ncbi:MAG: HAD-IC family P-type ATPase [bacterium]
MDKSPAGLTSENARKLLLTHGPNSIPLEHVTFLHILVRQFNSPFNYLLLVAAALAYILQEKTDAVMIIGFTLLNTLLGFYQEFRSEQTTQLLMNYLKHKATIIRDNQKFQINAQDIVRGDILVLKAGDIVPADCRLASSDLEIELDESSMTGESRSIVKQSGHPIYAGTTVMKGGGYAIVTQTGPNSQLGKLAHSTTNTQRRRSNFELNIGKVSSFTLKLITLILLATYVTNLALKGMDSFLETTLFSIALAVSVIPEALPVVITFSLSRGARNLARRGVVVKRLSAIEDLGGIEILATDKTGTITENKLSVTGSMSRLTQTKFEHYLGLVSTGNDTMSLALSKYRPHNTSEPVLSLPFDPITRYSQVVVVTNHGYLVLQKGIVEQIVACSHSPLTKEETAWIQAEESLGHRVIALATSELKTKPNVQTLIKLSPTLAGFISFADELKPSARLAIQKAHALGVDVRLISGDSPRICETIGKSIGLIKESSEIVTEAELTSLGQKDFHSRVKSAKIFARITPLMKSRLIDILQEDKTVGFIGDGVNDGPALKSADVGIAVSSASDVAKSAADIILTKKSLLTVLDGIEEGRLVFANTSKYIKMTLAANIGNFFSVAIASLLIPYLPMLPLQILMVNLLSDFPMIAVAGDTTDPSELTKPLSYNIHEIASTAIVFGLISSVFDLIFFSVFVRLGAGNLQTGWFIESIVTELLFFYSIRSRLPIWRSNPPPWGITILTLCVVGFTLSLPYLALGQTWLSLIPLPLTSLMTILTIIGGYLIATEILKIFYFRRPLSLILSK